MLSRRVRNLMFTLMILSFTLSASAQSDLPLGIGMENHVYVWDTATGNQIARIDQPVSDVLLNEDGSQIAISLGNGEVSVYDLSGDSPTQIASRSFGSSRWYYSIMPTAQAGRLIVKGTYYTSVWDFPTDTIAMTSNNRWTAVSPDGTRVLLIGENSLRLIDAVTLETLHRANISGITRYRWSPDSRLLVLATEHGFAIYDAATWRILYQYDQEQAITLSWEWSQDSGRFMAITSYDTLLRHHTSIVVVDTASLRDGSVPLSDAAHPIYTSNDRLAWSDFTLDSSRIILVIHDSPGIQVLDAATGDLLTTIAPDLSFFYAGLNADSTYLVGAGNFPEGYMIFDAQTGDIVYRHPSAEFPDFLSMAWMRWSPDHSRAAAIIVPQMQVDLWDFNASSADALGTPIVLPHTDFLLGAVWSGDGSRLATWTGSPLG